MLYLSLAFASFVFVFLKAFQQRAVVGNNFLTIIPTSLGLATAEVFSVATVARSGWSVGVVLSVGLSAGLGAILAMMAHNRIYRKPAEPMRTPPTGHPRPPFQAAERVEEIRARIRTGLGLPTADNYDPNCA